MEETDFLKDFEGIRDYRTFLVGLDKQFKSAGVLYREFKILEGMASIALKISPSIHNFISKQQGVVYSKLQTEVDTLANSIKRGKICFIKNSRACCISKKVLSVVISEKFALLPSAVEKTLYNFSSSKSLINKILGFFN